MAEGDQVRILVLEDDEDLRDMISMVLVNDGYDVAEASRGEDALNQASESPFDLIITDINTPGMNGLEALAEIKKHSPTTRALVITGYSTEADSIQAVRLGVGDYLKKPFSLDKLMASVDKLVAEIRAERKLLEREEALVGATVWAFETMARSLDLDHQERKMGWFKAGRMTRALALSLGQTPSSAQDAQLAVLAVGVARKEGADNFLALLSDSVVWLKNKLLEPPSSNGVPLSLTIAALGRELVDVETDEPIENQLAKPYPKELMTALAELKNSPLNPAGRSQGEGRRRQGLLSLARTLESSEDFDNAFEAYQELSQEHAYTREGVEALLGSARIARLKGDQEAATELATEVIVRATRLGPAVAALLTLEAGILLAKMGDAEAVAVLSRVVGWLEELQLRGPAARAKLALAYLGQKGIDLRGPLQVLAERKNIHELLSSARWLLPFLLENQGELPQPEGRALLVRLARDTPRELERLTEGLALSPEAQMEAVTAVKNAGVGFHKESLTRLSASSVTEVRQAALEALSQEGPTVLPPVLRIYSMGQFQVFKGEQPVKGRTWSTKVRYLMACLASRGGQAISEDTLLEEFWPHDPEQGRKRLWQATSRLRSLLKPKGIEGEFNYIHRTGNGLTLNPDLPRWHDLEELARVADQINKPGADVAALAVSLTELDRGAYLDGCTMDWALRTRDRVERTVAASYKKLGTLALEQSKPEQALECGHRLVDADSCSQDGFLLLMEGLVALNRPNEALKQFKKGENNLRNEMGVEPSIDMLRAFQKAKLLL